VLSEHGCGFPLIHVRCIPNGPVERRRRNGLDLTIRPSTPPAPIGC
jgi:hypothetical protein